MSENGFTEAQKKALMKLPGFKEIKKAYGQAGMGKKMRGMGFWDDLWAGIKSTAKSIDAWLTRTKALSTAAKVIGAVSAAIPGLQGVAPVAAGVATAAGAMGYGKKMKGGRRIDARSFASHVNPVAGSRGLVSQGMGSYAQNYQSPQLKMLGGATFPSHLQPFLKKGRMIGGGVSQAVGSIGNPGKIKV